MQNKKEIFGRNLRNIMREKGLSQTDVCKALNIHNATFSNWYNGRFVPDYPIIQKLADYFGCSFESLAYEYSDNSDTEKNKIFISYNSESKSKTTEGLLLLIKAFNDGLLTKEEFMEYKAHL